MGCGAVGFFRVRKFFPNRPYSGFRIRQKTDTTSIVGVDYFYTFKGKEV